MDASAADHVQHSALYQLFLRGIHSTLSTQTLALIAVLAQHSALYQLFLRVEPKRNNNKNAASKFTWKAAFFYCLIR
jgi:hypothetical protein